MKPAQNEFKDHTIAKTFKDGPLMIAIILMMETRYDCNGDMIVIIVLNQTLYDCNVFKKGPNMNAMLKFVLESRDHDF